MINVGQELGVQSYCFRGFKENSKVCELVKEIGVNAIELCGVHLDFTDESQFDAAISAYQDNGVKIVSIGVQGFSGDAAVEEKNFEFTRRAGAKFMAVDFNPATWQAATASAQAMAERYDVKLGIHNHGGPHWLGNRAMLRQLFAESGPRIGLCLDTAWAIDAREDPVTMVEEFSDRLFGLHIKDLIFDRARTPEDVVVGTGNMDLPKLQAALKKIDFAGYAVLEYEGDVDNPVPALSECVAAVRRDMSG